MKITKTQLRRILSEAASEAMIQKYVTEYMLGMDQEGEFRILVQQGMNPEDAIKNVTSEDMSDDDTEHDYAEFDYDDDDYLYDDYEDERDEAFEHVDDVTKRFLEKHPALADIEGMIGWTLSTGRNDDENEVMRKIGARLAYMAKSNYPEMAKAMLEELQDQ